MREMNSSRPVTACAVLVLLLALLGAVGIRTFLAPCVHEDGSFGSCHWAGAALFGLFLLMGATALAAAAIRDLRVREGLFLGLLGEALYGLFLPGPLIRLCSMATMRCQCITRPGAMVVLVLTMVLAAAGAILSHRGRKDGHP